MQGYLPRLVDPLVGRLLGVHPALLLSGPRAAGKTTTARRHAGTAVRLDRPGEAFAFRADPDAALRDLPEPILLDEWQAVPEVLGAVKRSVDDDPRPGRFLLTGSVRADLDARTWPGTGRLIRLPLYGLTVRELTGRATGQTFVDRVSAGGTLELTLPADPPDLRGYIELALRGTFPEPALRLPADGRQRWLESYVEQLLTHDIDQVDGGRDPERLRRYFEAVVLNTAGVVEDKTLYDAAGITAKTAAAYDRLLANLLIVESVPAWTSNRLKRLTRLHKRYVIDPALVAGALRLDVTGVMRDGNLLGRVLDTFVAAQLRPEVPVAASRPRVYHLRSEQGRHEVDILIELPAGRVIGIEVKADSAPRAASADHLRWLRDQLGERFVGGIVLHTGPRIVQLDESITAAPICSLWGADVTLPVEFSPAI